MQQQRSNGLRNFILGLLLVGIAIGVARYVKSNPPKAEREKPPVPVLQVETITATPQSYKVIIESYGTIQPRTQGTLTAQVNGEIIKVADSFRQGSFFEKGDVLLEIDPRDYQATLINAKANASQAQATLAQEQAQAKQAARDWKRLGNSGKAPDLVLRKPQLAAAKAQLEWNKAALAKAELDLQRTRIKAPYAGRIISKNVDLGQYVTTGAQIAEIFAIDYVEVRLPLTNREYAHIDVNESYRGEQSVANSSNSPAVIIHSQIGDTSYDYKGYISRSEGVFDTSTRQTFVVAHIDDPYGKRNEGIPPLKIGQFVTAKIEGKTLENVFILPNRAVYQGNYVFVVENDVVKRRQINQIWQDDDNTVINSGIAEGDVVVTTPLNNTISGTQVEISSI